MADSPSTLCEGQDPQDGPQNDINYLLKYGYSGIYELNIKFWVRLSIKFLSFIILYNKIIDLF